jgi:hypothetical protein
MFDRIDARDKRFTDDERFETMMTLARLFPAGEMPASLLASPWFPSWKLAGGSEQTTAAATAAERCLLRSGGLCPPPPLSAIQIRRSTLRRI